MRKIRVVLMIRTGHDTGELRVSDGEWERSDNAADTTDGAKLVRKGRGPMIRKRGKRAFSAKF